MRIGVEDKDPDLTESTLCDTVKSELKLTKTLLGLLTGDMSNWDFHGI